MSKIMGPPQCTVEPELSSRKSATRQRLHAEKKRMASKLKGSNLFDADRGNRNNITIGGPGQGDRTRQISKAQI
jgi:hypothetical protein